jgi:hypothetical protein
MKAEHRKELETNVLADRLGRMVTGLKEGPQRGMTMYIVLGVVAAFLVYLGARWYLTRQSANTDAWTAFAARDMRIVHEEFRDTKPGLALRFMIAWETMWDGGIKKLGSPDQKGALENLERARGLYEELKLEADGDPILEPEAMYALAQIEESKAVIDPIHLDRALGLFEELAKAHPKSAYGQLAEQRVEILSDDTKRRAVADVYKELETAMRFNRNMKNDK